MCRLIKRFRLKVCEKDLDALKGRTMDLMSAMRYCEEKVRPNTSNHGKECANLVPLPFKG